MIVVTFDEIREAYPKFGFAVYAYEPGGPVLLEIHTPSDVFPFKAPTLDGAIERAFPPEPEKPKSSVFD